MKQCLKKNALLIGVLLLVTVVFFWFGRAKAGFFIDEIHTYGLSNSHFAPYITDAAGGSLEDTVITKDQLIDYATVDETEILDFASVYSNQEADVHPPLYYFIFNAVSALAGENFTKWTGLLLDYVIYIAALIVLYFLSMELFSSNKAASICAVILYGMSTIGISTAVYIRMYVLLAFFTIVLAYFALKLIKTEKYKYCAFIGATIALGLLTQYYFVFYAFFLCAFLCAAFIKKPKVLVRLAVCSLIGVGLLIVLFPACLQHIFVGNGKVVGGVSVTEAIKDVSSYPERFNKFMHFVTYGLKAAIFCACLAIIVYRKFELKKEIVIIAAPALAAWAVIAIVSPVLEERYIYNIAPIFVLIAAWFIKDDMKAVYVAVIACIICLFVSKPNNLFSNYLEYDASLEPYTNDKCVYLQDNRFEGLTYDFEQLLMFDEIYATDSVEKASEYLKDEDEAVIFVDEDEFWSSGYDADELLPQIEGFDKYEQLYTNGFSGVYLISKGAA